MIPSITFDFNFDYILVLIFASYIAYGYFSGGHKQIRISINLILPFMVIYYLGKYITNYMYIPLSSTFLFELFDTYLGIVKNTFGMVIAYIFTYIMLFTSVFFLSIYARRYVLNENMRAKLGKKNNYLGAVFALINGYVLVYFIILPVFSLNLVGTEARITNFVLENPPPFSRIARTAEKAVPMKGLADKANDFQQLMSVDGIEGYYNDSIYDYQKLYIGSDSFESAFMDDIYSELSLDAKALLDSEYLDYFASTLSSTNFTGVSRVLLLETADNDYLYQDLLDFEDDFETHLNEMKAIADGYDTALLEYDDDVLDYLYGIQYEAYADLLDTYEAAVITYTTSKVNTLIAGTAFTDSLGLTRPEITAEKPANYVHPDTLVEPTEPVLTTEIEEADIFVTEYLEKADIRGELKSAGANFRNHKGLIAWYIDELGGDMASSSEGGNISDIIISFKTNYTSITEGLNDEELEGKLYLAQMSITSYDVFTEWLDCTLTNMETIELDDIGETANRCTNIDTSNVDDYDFTDDALGIVRQLFEGDSVTWIIMQFKYDYEAGGFVSEFEEFQEVLDILESTKELVDDYDLYYKDIANSLEGNLSMVIKIGISVMKYNLDIYETLSNSPIISSIFNDLTRVCTGSVPSPINRDVLICPVTEGESGFAKEIFNMRFLASDILIKAYLLVDDENEPIIYDTDKMNEFLAKTNESVEANVITQEVVSMFADQVAFNVIDPTNNYTILEQMYDDGQITIEAMRILADDEYELFSDEFRTRVRSLIR